MIVFDLECRIAAHRFEGWFGSSGDFASQLQGLLAGQFNGNLRERANRNAPRLSAHLLVEKKAFLAGLPHRKGQALKVDVVEVLSFPV